MLFETTLVVEQVDKRLESMGMEEASQIKYLPLQIDIRDIKYHHGYDHETDDGEYVQGTIIRYYDGDMVATLADFNEISKLRNQLEEEMKNQLSVEYNNEPIQFDVGGKNESDD